MAASDAVAFIRSRLKFEKVADIDPDSFYDFTQVRPTVHISNGERVLNWPINLISGQSREGESYDLMLLHGIEPHLAWQTYVETIIEISEKQSGFYGGRIMGGGFGGCTINLIDECQKDKFIENVKSLFFDKYSYELKADFVNFSNGLNINKI